MARKRQYLSVIGRPGLPGSELDPHAAAELRSARSGDIAYPLPARVLNPREMLGTGIGAGPPAALMAGEHEPGGQALTMPTRPRVAPGLVVVGWVANLIARSPGGAPRNVIGGHNRHPGGRRGDLVAMVVGRAAQVVAEFLGGAGDSLSAGLAGHLGRHGHGLLPIPEHNRKM